MSGLALAAITIPGLGPLFAAGPILGLLGAGAVTGGISGALAGWGVGSDKAKLYENGLKSGKAVLAVTTEDGEEGEVEEILRKNNGENIEISNS